MSEPAFRSELFAIAHEYVDREAGLSPILATLNGIEGYDDQLDDFSIAHAKEHEDLVRSTLRTVEGLEPSDDVDRVGRALMIERLTRQLVLMESAEYRRVFSVLVSPASEIRRVFEIQPAERPEHAEAIRARLSAVRASLETWRGALDEDSAAGRVPARRHALGVATQLETFVEGGYAEVARRLAGKCGVDAEEAGLLTAAADAEDSCAELAAWLRAEYAPRCDEKDAVGAERYRPWAEYFTGAQLELDELYEWGWQDLQRINARMWEIAKDQVPDATTLVEVGAALDADEARVVHGTDALLDRLRGLTAGAVEMLQGRHFDIDERIRFCDARLAPPGSASAAYYLPPSEDLSRPGTTWYPTLGRERFPLWRDVSTWYHESIPGHHLQLATSILEQDRQTRYQRLDAFVSGHGEGWALYAERLMEELGAFTDPADELGYLCGQALRAARIVVDIGMHLELPAPKDIGTLGDFGDVGGRVWDAPMAVAMLEERAMEENDRAVSEVDRYLGNPGQAISYKVGERVWLQCREDGRRRLGDAFDLKAWHAHALALGALGLDPFAEEMARFNG